MTTSASQTGRRVDRTEEPPVVSPAGDHRPWMIAAWSGGILLRIVAWLMLRRAFFCGVPAFEDAIHFDRARALMQGRIPETILPAGSPLYPYIAALLSSLTGGGTSGLLLLQSLAGVAAIPILVWALSPVLSLRGRWIAALLYALNPIPIFLGLRVQPFTFALLILLVVLRLLFLDSERTASRAVFGGLLCGLGFTLMPLLFTCTAAAAVWAYWRHSRPAGTGQARLAAPRMASILLLVAFLVLPALLCAYHDTLAGGGFAWNWTDAHAFYRSVQSDTWGTARSTAIPVWEDPARAQSLANETIGRRLTEWQTLAFYRGRALQHIAENPIAFVGQIVRRAVLLVLGPEIPDPVSVRFVLRNHAQPLAWGLFIFPLYLALAVIGFWRWRGQPFLQALEPFLIALLAVNLLGTYSSMSRALALVGLLPLAAAALEMLPALIRDARRTAATRYLLVVAASLMIVATLDLAGARSRFERDSEDLRYAATILLDQGQDRRGTTSLLRRALQKDPDNAAAHAALGDLLHKEELPDAARTEYEAALKITPGYEPALYGLAEVLRGTSSYAEANSLMVELVNLHPQNPLYLNQLATLEMMRGRFAEARFLLRRALEIAPDYQVALVNLRATDEAEQKATELALPSASPDSALVRLGQQAVQAVQTQNSHAADSLTALAVERFANEPLAWYMRGGFLLQMGRNDEAAECLLRVVRAAPGRALATEMAARALMAAGRRTEARAIIEENLQRAADENNRQHLQRLLESLAASPATPAP